MFNHKYRNWDCGLLSVDYGSETTGYIWTINSGMNFFFWQNCKANTHIFLYVYLNFLPVLHIVNSLKITKTLMYSVLTKGIKTKTGCKDSTMAKWQIDLRTLPPIASAHPFCASRETLPRARPQVSPGAYSMLTSICKKNTPTALHLSLFRFPNNINLIGSAYFEFSVTPMRSRSAEKLSFT